MPSTCLATPSPGPPSRAAGARSHCLRLVGPSRGRAGGCGPPEVSGLRLEKSEGSVCSLPGAGCPTARGPWEDGGGGEMAPVLGVWSLFPLRDFVRLSRILGAQLLMRGAVTALMCLFPSQMP